ncbi:fatty acid desaturase family protein [Cylindrospermum sp. FACHB-282]|uniref:fatty acid desaturase family protein n=1 Tax=Cylindrospermum sp. FACHB-282 TaxID=2692794 RepID=UPI001686397B|nr:fatty acid desaturase [Cylindrospermum sp. FACHB-282]MBD2385769.1 fatty acid desaturase [Cylindrospermum sp. FACHB-282]
MTQLKPSDFVEQNNFKASLALFRDWSAIFLVAAFSIWANNIFVYFLSIWIIGLFQFALGEVLTHEASHYNLFKKREWNENLELLYAFPVISTVANYRKHHLPHHKYLGKKQDYSIALYEQIGVYKPNNNLFFIWFIQPLIGLATFYLFLGLHTGIYYELKLLDYRPFQNGFKLSIFWLLIILTFYLSGNFHLLILYWFIPLLWPFACFIYWSELRDHFNTQSGTRSNISFLTNLLVHNRGYHYVHHLYPTIPWYKLPEAQKALCPDLPDTANGFFDTYRQLAITHKQFKIQNSKFKIQN